MNKQVIIMGSIDYVTKALDILCYIYGNKTTLYELKKII